MQFSIINYVPRCAVLSRLVMSDSANPWTVARQAPLSMGILQVRILEWEVYPFARDSPWSRNPTGVSCAVGEFFTSWATGEAFIKSSSLQKSS